MRLFEARRRLGGRARGAGGDYQANLGPHALYSCTDLWGWLRARGLHVPSRRVPVRRVPTVRFRWKGELRRLPPMSSLQGLRRMTRAVPVDRDLRSWAIETAGEDGARLINGLAGPLVFDHDAGRLSAASVMEKARNILLQPVSPARYLEGGWNVLVDRVAAHARTAGAVIETSQTITSVDDVAAGPVVVALDPAGARKLLGNGNLRPESPRVALLDVGLEHRRGDPYIVFDLDDAAFVDRFTAVVPSLAPPGRELVQASVGLRPDERLESGVARLEAVLDQAFQGWRDRLTWYKRGLVTEATGAVDLPGTTWQDRTPIAYTDGIWLAGDWVAAPGHLAEVSCTSAIEAARGALAAVDRTDTHPVR